MKDEGSRERSSFILLPSSFRKWFPAISFLGGFVWDALTLGRSIKSIDLVILLGYLIGAAAILVLMGREVAFRGSQYLDWALQFLFGGIFSALFIFYFLSSGGLAAYLVVFALAALLVGNEFLQGRYRELTLSWAFFAICATMFFNFALAHLFRSISTFWFYAGSAVAIVLVLGLRRLTTRPSSITPAIAVAALLVVLHAVNAIPPVPLVKKEMLVAHNVRRAGRNYEVQLEPRRLLFWRRTIHRAPGERVYCFTSVFVPPGIATTIRHRWWYRNGDGWQPMFTVPFRIEGGRQGGYRGYTFTTNPRAGRWRVVAESETGAAIGVVEFDVVSADSKPRLRTLHL